ncbi:hypothetical protein BSKO_12881 [Bryopsis sp. KO-2023]|nr:hypothetical protein BSKO_12881 [Bryopsis sp. KO-2023]
MTVFSLTEIGAGPQRSNSVKELVNIEWNQRLSVLDDVGSPAWLYSCRDRRNIWANNAALTFFARPATEFLDPAAFGGKPGDGWTEAVNELNEKISQKVETEGVAQQCTVTGNVGMLPGWLGSPPHMSQVSHLITYKPFDIERCGKQVRVTLVQVELQIDQWNLVEANTSRLMVMHQYNPINSFLFDQQGNLLLANPAAHAYYGDVQDITLRGLFEEGLYADGSSCNQDYDSALHIIFNEKRAHRSQYRRFSRKNPTKQKWCELEMWPTTDPVTNRPAVLVSKQNITQTKEAEEALKEQRNILQSKNFRLEKELEAKYEGVKSFDQASPLDITIKFLDRLMEGEVPPVQEMANLKTILLTCENLREPTQLKEQLLAEVSYERDVGLNLLQLLGGGEKTNTMDCLTKGPVNKNATNKEKSMFSKKMIQRGLMRDQFVPSTIVPAVEQILMKTEHWTWDAFELTEATQGCPCSTLAFWTLKKSGLISHFQLDEVKLSRFLRRIEEGYPENPYHNRLHACDVLQSLHMVMVKGGIFPKYADRLCQLAAYMAAILHDFEHGGLNNDYLVKSADVLALRYNDRSPLENHHLAGAFQVFRHPECFFMGKLSPSDISRFRQLCIDMVLATDMKQHFSILSQFQAKLKILTTTTPVGELTPEDMKMDENQLSLVLQIALKCSDVGHLACSRVVHKKWVALLEEEFFRQGDQERMNGMKISPLMDRLKPGITKSQVGFFDIVALPLFRSFASIFTQCTPLLESVEDNFLMWKEMEQGSKA